MLKIGIFCVTSFLNGPLIGKRDFAYFLIFKMSAKGAKVQRRTFDKWAVSGVLGHKIVIELTAASGIYGGIQHCRRNC